MIKRIKSCLRKWVRDLLSQTAITSGQVGKLAMLNKSYLLGTRVPAGEISLGYLKICALVLLGEASNKIFKPCLYPYKWSGEDGLRCANSAPSVLKPRREGALIKALI